MNLKISGKDVCCRFGPDSPEMDAKLLDMNECLGQLLSVVPSNVNFLLVSDHGMTTFTKNLTIPVHNDLFVLRGKDYSEWLIDPKPGFHIYVLSIDIGNVYDPVVLNS